MSRVAVAAPLAGWLTSVREVPDPVFAEEMMGSGIAIDPIDGALIAPCDAEVLLVGTCDGYANIHAPVVK